MNIIFPIMEIPGLIFAMWLIQRLGLRFAMVACAGLQIGGSWLRFYGAYPDRFFAMVAGSIIASLGQPFLDASPTTLVGSWFGDNERTTAVSLFVMFGWTGSMALCVWQIPQLVVDDDTFKGFILITACICTVVGLANLLIQEEKPETPPSLAAAMVKPANFKDSFIGLFKAIPFLILLFSWGATLGILQFYFLSAGVIFGEPTFSQGETGEIASFAGITGLVSCLLGGLMVDKFRNYKTTLIVGHALSATSLLVMAILHENPDHYIGMFILSGVYGWFALVTYPTALELGAELTFPIEEQFSAAILVVSACVWTVVVAYIVAYENSEWGQSVGLYTLMAIMTFTTIATIFIKPDYRRLEYEKNKKQ